MSVSVGVRTRRHVCVRRGIITVRALEIENALPIYESLKLIMEPECRLSTT